MFASPNVISLSTVIVEGWALKPIAIVLSDVVWFVLASLPTATQLLPKCASSDLCPIDTLLFPVKLAESAYVPLATLYWPVVKLEEHKAPTAVFSPLPPFEPDRAA